jgi:hypothetical protein
MGVNYPVKTAREENKAMKKRLLVLGLAGVMLCSVLLFAPGDSSWGADDF